MRPERQSAIGVVAAIPFLLSLLVTAAFVFAANSGLRMLEARLDAAGQAERDRLAGAEREAEALREQIARAAGDGEQRFVAATEAKATVEERVRALRAEIEAADARIAGLRREIDAKERIPATQLAPAGTKRAAVYVECEDGAAWIMPERRRLAVPLSAEDQDVFLRRVQSTGYAVFLIRPAGIEAFKAYRGVLEDFNATAGVPLVIGFEPVDAGWKLAYPGGPEGQI